jgi:hypothetical protein
VRNPEMSRISARLFEGPVFGNLNYITQAIQMEFTTGILTPNYQVTRNTF